MTLILITADNTIISVSGNILLFQYFVLQFELSMFHQLSITFVSDN
jgi:hypothetical protein